MSSEITLNNRLIETAKATLDKAEVIDEAVSITADGITAVLSSHVDDMLSALHELQHNGTTYYIGIPHE